MWAVSALGAVGAAGVMERICYSNFSKYDIHEDENSSLIFLYEKSRFALLEI